MRQGLLSYNRWMFDLENPIPVDDEDQITLAAIDEGLRDVLAGRTVDAKEVREREGSPAIDKVRKLLGIG